MLVSTLALLAVLLIIFLAAMTYCLNRYGQHVRTKNRMVASFLADAGVKRALHRMTDGTLFPSKSKEATPNGGTVQASSLAWGPYVLIRSRGDFANQTVVAIAVIGSAPPEYFDAAVTVTDMNYPLVVAGNTTIRGDVNTGPLGMTTGRIRGEGIVNENFHTGALRMLQTPTALKLNPAVLDRYHTDQRNRRIPASRTYSGTQVWQVIDRPNTNQDYSVKIENNLRIENCEYASPALITSLFVNGYVEIAGSTRLSGLTEIVADGPIYLRDSSVMDQGVLWSEDSIVMSGSAHFSGIAMSNSRIVVKDKVALSYPGSLLITGDSITNYNSCGIWLMSRGVLEGLCCLRLKELDAQEKDYQIYLDTSSTFTGGIISEGKVDLRGTVYGTIVTSRFSYTEPTTTYINWAKDFHVDRTKLTFALAAPILGTEHLQSGFRILSQETLE